MNNKDGLNYKRVCVGKMFLYSVCEDGTVLKTSRKWYRESRVTPYLKRGMVVVKINGREHTLKNLVARHFHKDYRAGDYVEVMGGNPFNCSVKNLRIYN